MSRSTSVQLPPTKAKSSLSKFNNHESINIDCSIASCAAPPASAFQHSDNATSWKTTEAAGNKAAQEAHFDEAERLLTTNLAVAENIAKTVGPEDDRLPA